MNDDKTSVDLDLDALVPKVVQINYRGDVIKVNPLNLEQYTRLLSLGSEMSKIDTADSDKMLPIYEEVRRYIDTVIPDFVGKDLNPLQITAIFSLLAKLSTPEDKAVKELAKQGVNLTDGNSDPKALTS